MITKSCREIVRQAKSLANADNSQFTDFFLSTTLLNNAYRDLYDTIIANSDAFVETMVVSGTKADLPENCYKVLQVQARNGDTISPSSANQNPNVGWHIVNGTFYKPKGYSEVLVTYATLPATLTAPDEWKKVQVYDSDMEYIDDDLRQEAYVINITEDEEYQILRNRENFGDYAFDITIGNGNITKVTYNNEDITEIFSRDGVTIKTFNYDYPYIAVSYSDERTFIFTGFDNAVEYNYECIYGHPTKGYCIALTTDDTTGFGMIFRKYNRVEDSYDYYYAPFVPDTILAYPNNTLFSLLEFKLAYILAGLLGMDTAFIEKCKDEAEENFVGNIAQQSNARRMTNTNGHWTRLLWN